MEMRPRNNQYSLSFAHIWWTFTAGRACVRARHSHYHNSLYTKIDVNLNLDWSDLCFFSSDFSLRLDSLFQIIPLTHLFHWKWISKFGLIFIRTQSFRSSFFLQIENLCVLLFLFCSKNQNLIVKISVCRKEREKKERKKIYWKSNVILLCHLRLWPR